LDRPRSSSSESLEDLEESESELDEEWAFFSLVGFVVLLVEDEEEEEEEVPKEVGRVGLGINFGTTGALGGGEGDFLSILIKLRQSMLRWPTPPHFLQAPGILFPLISWPLNRANAINPGTSAMLRKLFFFSASWMVYHKLYLH